MLNLKSLKISYLVEFIVVFLFVINFLFPDKIFSSKKRSIISGVEVRVYKKEKKHIETSALLCALFINGYSLKEIKKNLEINFPKPISKSDEFLINDLMSNICPEFGNKKIFEN